MGRNPIFRGVKKKKHSNLRIHIFPSEHRKGVLGYRKTNSLLKKFAQLLSRLKGELQSSDSLTAISREPSTLDVSSYNSHVLISATFTILAQHLQQAGGMWITSTLFGGIQTTLWLKSTGGSSLWVPWANYFKSAHTLLSNYCQKHTWLNDAKIPPGSESLISIYSSYIFIHSFSKCLLSAYYVQITVLEASAVVAGKTQPPPRAHFPHGCWQQISKYGVEHSLLN